MQMLRTILLASLIGGILLTPTSVAYGGDGESPASWFGTLLGGASETAQNTGVYSGSTGDTLGDTVVNILTAVIGFLGVIATILIVYAGYLWMTAGGDDSQIDKAKSIIKQVIIGFIVLSLSYAIVSFVFSQVQKAAPGA